MSEPTEGSPIATGVKKQIRRFAPKRGASNSAAGMRRDEAAKKAATTEATETSGDNGESSTTAATTESSATSNSEHKTTSIGTIRPEGANSGRLQSVNDGQKTRGGATKMKFKPTIPHKRNKKEASSSAIDEALSTKYGHSMGERGGRGGARGRGRGRGRGLVIVDESTASGIFSLGPSMVARSRPNYSGGGLASYGGDLHGRNENDSAQSDMVEMFTDSAGQDLPVMFRHVSHTESDIDPVTLQQTVGKVPWMSVRSQKKKSTGATTSASVKLEEDNMDVDASNEADNIEEEEEESRELPKVYMNGDSPAQNIFALDEKQRIVCVAEEELLYFQLPSIVPKFEKVVEKKEDMEVEETNNGGGLEEGQVKVEKEVELPPAAKKSSLLHLEESMANMGLEDMPNGEIGKLIVYKSGKMKMKLGNILMDVNQGTQSSFLENVMAVDHESEETKKAIELGHIVQKFVCIPNMDALLQEEEKALF